MAHELKTKINSSQDQAKQRAVRAEDGRLHQVPYDSGGAHWPDLLLKGLTAVTSRVQSPILAHLKSTEAMLVLAWQSTRLMKTCLICW